MKGFQIEELKYLHLRRKKLHELGFYFEFQKKKTLFLQASL